MAKSLSCQRYGPLGRTLFLSEWLLLWTWKYSRGKVIEMLNSSQTKQFLECLLLLGSSVLSNLVDILGYQGHVLAAVLCHTLLDGVKVLPLI